MQGFKQDKEPSLKSRVKQLEQLLENSNMAVRILQMSVQQMMQSFEAMNSDVGSTMNIANDLQYRTLAMIELNKFDTESLNKIAEEFKLNDFNKASDAEDVERGYTVIEGRPATKDDIVILTSTTENKEDQGIFRSKIKLGACGVPDLIEAIEGKNIGDKVSITINNAAHEVELLAIREEPNEVEPTELEKTLQEAEALNKAE